MAVDTLNQIRASRTSVIACRCRQLDRIELFPFFFYSIVKLLGLLIDFDALHNTQ